MLSSLSTTDKVAAAVVGTVVTPYVMPFVGAYYLAPYLPRREYILDSLFPNQRAAWRESFTDPSQQTKRVQDFLNDPKHKDDPSLITLEHPIQNAYDELKKNIQTLIEEKKPPTVLRVAGKITEKEAGSMDLQGNVGVVLAPNGAFLVTKDPADVKKLTNDSSVLSQLNTHFSKAELGGTATSLDEKDINVLKQICPTSGTRDALKTEYPLDKKTETALKKYQEKVEKLQETLTSWKLTYTFTDTSSNAAAIHKEFEDKAKELQKELSNAQTELERDLSKNPEKNTIMAKVKDTRGTFDNTIKDKLIELHQDAQLQRDKFALIVDLMKDSHNKKAIEAQLEEIQNQDAVEYDRELQQEARQKEEQVYTDEIEGSTKKITKLEEDKKRLTEQLKDEKDIGLPEEHSKGTIERIELVTTQISQEEEKKTRAQNNLAQLKSSPLPTVTARAPKKRKGLSSIDLNALLSNNAYLRTPTGNRIQIKQGPTGTSYALTRSWKSYLVGNQNSQADWEALARIMVAQGCPKGVDIRIGNDVPEHMKDKEALKAFEAFIRAGVPKELIDVKIERQDPEKKGSYKEDTLTWDNHFKNQTTATWYEKMRGQSHEHQVHTTLDKPASMQQPGQSKNKMTFNQLETKYDELRGTSKEVRKSVLEQEKAEKERKEAEAKKAEEQKSAPEKDTQAAPTPKFN